MRLLMPDLAKQMEEEGVFTLIGSSPEGERPFCHVEDRGSDTTVFVFSGVDVLYAGLARYEFQKLFTRVGKEFNLVFFRDLHRTAYHFTPEGEVTGLDFHTQKINEIIKDLGSKFNISLGSSSGGSAALYFGVRCKMDHVLAFGPLLTEAPYSSFKATMQAIFDIKRLFVEPKAYFELLVVSLGARIVIGKLRKHVGEEHAFKPHEDYGAANPRPTASIIYGRFCRPDAFHAVMLDAYPEVKIIPIDTGRHNSPGFLKSQGKLEELIISEIKSAFSAPEAMTA